MNTNIINETVVKSAITGTSAVASWQLQDISYIASIIASCVGILVGAHAIYTIIKGYANEH